jgi:putative phage-type endonuclease
MKPSALTHAPQAGPAGEPANDGAAAALPEIPGVEMVPSAPSGSPEWHAMRRTGIGGSDVAAIMGLSQYRSPYEVWLDKRGQLERDETHTPPAVEWGTRLEGPVRQAYADKTGRQVWIPNVQFRSKAIAHMTANVDGLSRLLAEPALPWRGLEVKTARSGEAWGEPGTDDVPVPYMLQVQHYMIVLPVAEFDLAVLIGGSDFRIYTIRPDVELQAMILDAEAEFVRRVHDNDPPPIVSPEDARRRWGKFDTRATVVAGEIEIEAIRTLHDAREHTARLEAEEKRCEALIMAALADRGDTLTLPDGRVLATWKRANGANRIDAAALRAAHPEIAKAFTNTGDPTRRFLLKEVRP